jgi:uncharacterized membrane-anchored protein YitT (DUF2179 family)
VLDWFFYVAAWFSLAVGVVTLAFGLFGRPPHNLMALGLAGVELLLLVQLATTIVLTAGGARAATDTVEFYLYILTALVIPVAAVLWALLDRHSRWSTVVLAVAALSVAIMFVRMHQIWTGNFNL